MMLPTIKTRFHTEDAYRQIWRKEATLVLKPRKYRQISSKGSFDQKDQKFHFDSFTAAHSVKPPSSKLSKLRVKTQSIRQKRHNTLVNPEESKVQASISRKSIHNGNSLSFSRQQTKASRDHTHFAMNGKLNQVMRLFERQDEHQKSVKKVKRSLAVQEVINSTRYDSVAEEFSKLPKQKSKWSIQELSNFLYFLREINPFFHKINDLVAICLLKVGKVQIYHEGQFVQKEDHPMLQMGIILWGELLLKAKGTSMKIFCLPGDSLNQETLFKEKASKSFEKLYFKHGVQSIKESAKTQTKAALLYFNQNQYRTIFSELVKIGEKSGILTAENMMKWSYAKKKNIRKQYSHIH